MLKLKEEYRFENWEIEQGLNKLNVGLYGKFEAETLRIYSDGSTRFYGKFYPAAHGIVEFNLPENTKYVYAELKFDSKLDPWDAEFISDLRNSKWYTFGLVILGNEAQRHRHVNVDSLPSFKEYRNFDL